MIQPSVTMQCQSCCSYFTGTGRAGDTAPGERHLYRVPVSSSAGAEPTCLTCPDTGEETGDTCTSVTMTVMLQMLSQTAGERVCTPRC